MSKRWDIQILQNLDAATPKAISKFFQKEFSKLTLKTQYIKKLNLQRKRQYRLIIIKFKRRMNLKNHYEYLNDYCGYYIIKQSMYELKDIGQAGKIDSSSIYLDVNNSQANNSQPHNSQLNNVPAEPINGYLYRKFTLPYCIGGVPCPCVSTGYEVEGYSTTLSEVKIPTTCFQCNPEFQVIDGHAHNIGHFSYNCFEYLLPCCAELHVRGANPQHTFSVKRPYWCQCYICGIKWEVRDATGVMTSEIIYNGGCCGCRPNFRFNFLGNTSTPDKLLLLSSIPFLP